MRTRLKLDFWLPLLLWLAPSFVWAVPSGLPDPEAGQRDTVAIEYPVQTLLPYRQRRSDWGVVFGVEYSNLTPTAYNFTNDSNNINYQDDFGDSPVALVGVQIGAKRNLGFGSWTAEFSYQNGSVSSGANNMNVMKTGLHAGLWFDMIWSEPYVVPYAQADLAFFNYSATLSEVGGDPVATSGSTTLYGATAGLLVQLNWIDSKSSLDADNNSGIQNTYLDLFVSTLNHPSSGADLSDSVDWGAGLRMEF